MAREVISTEVEWSNKGIELSGAQINKLGKALAGAHDWADIASASVKTLFKTFKLGMAEASVVAGAAIFASKFAEVEDKLHKINKAVKEMDNVDISQLSDGQMGRLISQMDKVNDKTKELRDQLESPWTIPNIISNFMTGVGYTLGMNKTVQGTIDNNDAHVQEKFSGIYDKEQKDFAEKRGKDLDKASRMAQDDNVDSTTVEGKKELAARKILDAQVDFADAMKKATEAADHFNKRWFDASGHLQVSSKEGRGASDAQADLKEAQSVISEADKAKVTLAQANSAASRLQDQLDRAEASEKKRQDRKTRETAETMALDRINTKREMILGGMKDTAWGKVQAAQFGVNSADQNRWLAGAKVSDRQSDFNSAKTIEDRSSTFDALQEAKIEAARSELDYAKSQHALNKAIESAQKENLGLYEKARGKMDDINEKRAGVMSKIADEANKGAGNVTAGDIRQHGGGGGAYGVSADRLYNAAMQTNKELANLNKEAKKTNQELTKGIVALAA